MRIFGLSPIETCHTVSNALRSSYTAYTVHIEVTARGRRRHLTCTFGNPSHATSSETLTPRQRPPQYNNHSIGRHGLFTHHSVLRTASDESFSLDDSCVVRDRPSDGVESSPKQARERRSNDLTMAFKEIPILDLSEAKSAETKPAFLNKLRDALLNVG